MSADGHREPSDASIPMPLPQAPSRALAPYGPTLLSGVPEEEIDLRKAWEVILRHRGTILTVTGLIVTSAVLATLLMRPVYRGTALVEVRPQSGGLIRFNSLEGVTPMRQRSYLQTQWRIIRSNSVAEAVIASLQLDSDLEFRADARQRSFVSALGAMGRSLVGWASERTGDSEADADLDQELVSNFLDHVEVAPVRDSDLVEVSFYSHDPELAARAANATVEEYSRLSEERRFSSISSAKHFLEREIANARAQLESSERRLNEFARRHDIVGVTGSTTLTTSRVAGLGSELSAAVGQRIAAQSAYLQLGTASASDISAVLANELIRHLKEKHAYISGEYARQSRIFRDDYPEQTKLKSELRQIEATLERETQRVAASLHAEYQRAAHREKLIRAELESEKLALAQVKDRAVEHNILQREWETTRQVYVSLLEQLKEVGVAAGLEANNVAVIDHAKVPLEPHAPDLLVNTSAALSVGLGLGTLLAFLLAYLDDGIRTSDALEAHTGLSSLGIVPWVDGGELNSRYWSEAEARVPDPVSEALRAVRTNLLFSARTTGARMLQITSAMPSEGKTTIAANLAVLLAQAELRVLLIDGDLRRPKIHEAFGVPRSPGLSDVLGGSIEAAVHKSSIPNLSVLPAGSPVLDPVEVLGGTNLRKLPGNLSDGYDFIIVDSAPVLGLADSVVVATKVEGVLLVASAAETRKGALSAAIKNLQLVRAPLIGAVLNKAEGASCGYGVGYYDDGEVGLEASARPTTA